MSVTQNWSWIFSMNSSLYNQLRNLIYSKIVPANTITTYDDDVITLNFSTLRTVLTLSTDQQDVIQINAPINGNMQPTGGVQVPFSGTVTALIDLNKVYIQGDGSDDNASGEQGITWTNFLYLESGVISELAIHTGDSTTDATLTSFIQSEIDSYVSSSPHSLGQMSSSNLNPYFVPTYQKFITLTDSSNGSNPRMMQLVMVNNEDPPTADPHNALDQTSSLDFPDGANAVFAFNDYTIYDFMATQMEDSDDNIFDSISVSQNPAVLTAKGDKKSYAFTLSSQISNNAMATKLNMTNAIEANLKYATTFDIENEDDGSQALVINNDLSSSNVGININNPVIISLLTLQATLIALSPLHGVIYTSILMAIEQKIISVINKAAKKLEFEEDVPLQPGTGNVGVSFVDITLNGGVVISANMNVSASNEEVYKTPTLKVNSIGMEAPKTLNEGLKSLSTNLDKLHTELTNEV